ncbi:MAG TPA: PaaI family thioesterase [Ilumatobacter sp.]|nr:PaaI family thioesterase [Ilumatobacter sp.]
METPDIEAARQRAGAAIRDLGHAFIGRTMTMDQIERLADALETVSAELWPGEPRERAKVPFSDRQQVVYPQGRISHGFSDRPISGQSSPWGLDLSLHRDGDEIEAHVTLRAAHEGAPGRSHGGIVAALFDDVFGYVLGVAQQPGFTGDLYLRYEAPTPIHEELACRVRLADREGRKMLMTGELVHRATGQRLVSARATFIAVDAAAFERQTAERPAPPAE